MNRFKTLEERREATKQLIANELYKLREKGFNPISGNFAPELTKEIEPNTNFIEALWKAYDLTKLENTTKLDVRTLII